MNIDPSREIEFTHMPRPTRLPKPIPGIRAANRSEISIRVMRAAFEGLSVKPTPVFFNSLRAERGAGARQVYVKPRQAVAAKDLLIELD